MDCVAGLADRRDSNGHSCYGLEYRSLKREPKAGRLRGFKTTQAAVRIGQRHISNVQSEIEGRHAERMELGQSGGPAAQHAGEAGSGRNKSFQDRYVSAVDRQWFANVFGGARPSPCPNASGSRGGRACWSGQ